MPYIGSEPNTGLFVELDSLTASATADYTLQLNGANYFPETVNNLLVSINGVIQGSSTMALNGSTLTVGATLSSSDVIDFVRVFGNVGSISTPTDGSVTANKIGSGAITNVKVADNASISGSKLGTGAILQVKYFQLTTPQTETYGTTNTDMAVTNFNINITPKSTSSIIKLEANIMFEWVNDPWDTLWFFYRNTTKLSATNVGNRRAGISPSLSSHGGYGSGDNEDSTPEFATLTYFDAPTSTSQITYKLGVNSSGTNNLFINSTINTSDVVGYERGVSFISATEIGG